MNFVALGEVAKIERSVASEEDRFLQENLCWGD